MKNRIIRGLLTLFVVSAAMLGNVNTVHAYTQDELVELWEQRAAEEGINIEEYNGSGQSAPAPGYEYGGENNPNQNPAPLAGESNNANTQQPVATEKPADTKSAHEHKYTADLTTDPTCTEEGIMTYTCECGDTYTEPYPALGHQYKSEITKEATCVEEGEETFTCTLCGDTYTEAIFKTDHVKGKEEVVKAATCTEAGEKVTYCAACDKELSKEEIPATGHALGEQELIKNATLFSKGEAVIKCTECQEVLDTIFVPMDTSRKVIYIAVIVAVFAAAVGLLTMIILKKKKI